MIFSIKIELSCLLLVEIFVEESSKLVLSVVRVARPRGASGDGVCAEQKDDTEQDVLVRVLQTTGLAGLSSEVKLPEASYQYPGLCLAAAPIAGQVCYRTCRSILSSGHLGRPRSEISASCPVSQLPPGQ